MNVRSEVCQWHIYCIYKIYQLSVFGPFKNLFHEMFTQNHVHENIFCVLI